MLTLETLAGLVSQHAAEPVVPVREFELRGRPFRFNSQSHVMGVINLSPDSWYRESVSLSTEAAVQRGRVLRAQGADVVDVGAESTLANASRADIELQCARLVPVIRELSAEGSVVSVETYEPEVARRCLEAGAAILNLTGTTRLEQILPVVADHGAGVIFCFVQGEHVRAVGDFSLEGDPIAMMYDYFARVVEQADAAGARKVFIDPGMGFYYRNLQDSSVRVRHQMRVFLNSFRLRRIGVPICHALPHAFEFFREEVRVAEPFFAVLAALGKTDLFRTHEVPRTRAVLDTLRAF